MNELCDVELSGHERKLLARGLREWGGPAHCSEAMAVALGFEGTESLLRDGSQLAKRIAGGAPLSREDWTRALMATEVVFVSDVVGSGVDWISTTEHTDAETIEALRTIQRKLVAVVFRPGKTGDVPGWLSR